MRTIYEVLKDGQTLHGGSFYTHKTVAEARAHNLNKNVITRIMFEANRVNGAIRGANKEEFLKMIDDVAQPPYTVRKVNVNQDYR